MPAAALPRASADGLFGEPELMPFDFKNYSLWLNIVMFAVSAGIVWIAGTKVSHYADAIAEHTGIGHAAAGLILLGGITSLPEVAVTVASSAAGNAPLAVNNILGSLAINVVILALADAVIGRDALTSVIPDPVVILQGALGVLLLALVSAAVIVGDTAFLGIGGWAWSILLFYFGAIWMLAKSQGRFPWRPDGLGWHQRRAPKRPHQGLEGQHRGHPAQRDETEEEPERPFGKILGKTVLAGLAILVAGYALSRSGETLAEQSGLGSSFFGAVFVGFSTSLPEVSTVLAAMHLGRYLMAVSDIFGTNLFNVGMIFLIDAVYPDGPVLNQVGRFSSFAALLGIVVTTLYIAGLVERRDRTILRMGYDSLAVLLTYLGGIFLLYRLR
jgi:cation:H+ antiporter